MDEYIKFSGKSIKDASNHLFGSLLLLSILLRPFSKLCLRCQSFAVGFNRRSEASTPEIEMVTSVRLSLLLWFSALTWMLCTYVSTIIALVFSLNLDAMYIVSTIIALARSWFPLFLVSFLLLSRLPLGDKVKKHCLD